MAIDLKKKEETAIKKVSAYDQIVGSVQKRVEAMQQNGSLHFPPDYSPGNALNSAWLILQEIKDKDGNPALNVCTRSSIGFALLDMVLQGLNPAKEQGYFIVYGNQLSFQRSYFGTMAVAKLVDHDIADIPAEVVYSEDEFEFEIVKGHKFVTLHKQKFGNIEKSSIIGAYSMIIDQNGEVRQCVIMTMDEIKKAWAQSKMKPILDNGEIKKGTVHEKFTAEMCKRTVINRIAKPIINSSNDANLKLAAGRSEVLQAEGEVQEEADQHANQDFLDLDIDETGTAAIPEKIESNPSENNSTSKKKSIEPDDNFETERSKDRPADIKGNLTPEEIADQVPDF